MQPGVDNLWGVPTLHAPPLTSREHGGTPVTVRVPPTVRVWATKCK